MFGRVAIAPPPLAAGGSRQLGPWLWIAPALASRNLRDSRGPTCVESHGPRDLRAMFSDNAPQDLSPSWSPWVVKAPPAGQAPVDRLATGLRERCVRSSAESDVR
jgi:hypothetical protein